MLISISLILIFQSHWMWYYHFNQDIKFSYTTAIPKHQVIPKPNVSSHYWSKCQSVCVVKLCIVLDKNRKIKWSIYYWKLVKVQQLDKHKITLTIYMMEKQFWFCDSTLLHPGHSGNTESCDFTQVVPTQNYINYIHDRKIFLILRFHAFPCHVKSLRAAVSHR